MDVQLKKIQEQLQEERRLRELAEHRVQQAEGRAELAENQTRRTTLEELLELCHRVSQSMSVQTDKSLSTQGSTTSPKGKCCPTMMRPWKDFPIRRQSAFDEVYNILYPPNDTAPQLFSPPLHIEELGRTISSRKIASEEDLKFFQHSMVENFVTDIISALAANQRYNALSQGVVFENHTNTLSDIAEDVQHRLQMLSSSKDYHRTSKPIYADQICVYKNEDDKKDLLTLIEYKPPHKFKKEILRAGLRVMDVPKEVINRPTIPIDPHEKFCYNADRLVAAAVTQTYSYMLESGVEYSCIVTGEALVFLRIKADDANTVFYHLAEPTEEVRTTDGLDFKHPLTAIGQLLSFCLMALQSERRNELWRRRSTQRAQTWSEDWEKILHDIPQEVRKLEPPPSVFMARTYPINKRSPYLLRRKNPKSLLSGCSTEGEPTGDDNDEGGDPTEDQNEGPESIHTPSKGGSSTSRGKQGQDGRRGAQSSSSAGKQRQYCTQGCLLGMVLGSALDDNCPNARLHRRGKKVRRHLLNKQQFAEMVQRQLARTLDRNCKDLKIQGSTCTLFQITLASYGYTFVGKGTRDVFVPDLMHEGRMYDRLKSVQGKLIPVYLGNIELNEPWLDLRVRIIHMLLMSWGGEEVDKVKEGRTFDTEIKRFESQIARMGVQHEDIRPPNMLWNRETNGVMFIDLERATELRRIALQEIPANRKRKRSVGAAKLDTGIESVR